MYHYNSDFLYGGDAFLRQYLEIDNINIIFRKETSIFGITFNEVVIPKKYIRKISIENRLIGCDVLIYYCYPFKNYDEIIRFEGIKKEYGLQIKRLLL